MGRGPCDSPDPHQGCTAQVELPWETGRCSRHPPCVSVNTEHGQIQDESGCRGLDGLNAPGTRVGHRLNMVSHVLRLLPWIAILSVGFTDRLREAAKWGRYQLRGRGTLHLSMGLEDSGRSPSQQL